MKFAAEREEIAYFMRRLYDKNLTTTSGGNISWKIDNNQILVTASQTDKGTMQATDIGLVNIEGESEEKGFQSSMETGMHLEVYKSRPDAKVIVHAHPIFATAFAITAQMVNCKLMGEARAICGEATLAGYRLMGTKDLAQEVAQAAKSANIVMMQNHGVLAVGDTLLQAFDRMEVFETSAKLTFLTEMIGGKKELTPEELKQIDNLF